jgi:putative membrane-bound dehydrogenase-like protein
MRYGFALLMCFLLMMKSSTICAAEDPPRSLDSRFQLVEFAAAPDIVTPTGMTVDSKGRVWAIESHTHFRPENYDGPKADRIKVFEDTNGDGKADHYTVFHEGGRATMGIGIHPNGGIYAAERSKITRYWDEDGDLKPEKQEILVRLETKGDYPHNGLSGFAFDMFGNVYFGLGENLGEAYKVICKDGSKYEGGGEGGSIFRCGEKGSELKMIATGFWNPFHLCFNSEGRLFAVDNDPDSRPPCRLLHIVDQGDYGYRFRNGRKGLHPFTAWNGELPGTLPMLAGTGEAPSGVIEDAIVGGSLLVTSWGDHRIERYTLEKSGGSYTAKKSIVVQGGENFRPVGIGQDAKGNVYFTDWVSKDYNLHKRGRIWTLRPVGVTRIASRGVPSAVLEWVGAENPKLDSADPFERHGAQNYVARAADWVSAKSLKDVASPLERSEWAVAMRHKTPKEAPIRIGECDLSQSNGLARNGSSSLTICCVRIYRSIRRGARRWRRRWLRCACWLARKRRRRMSKGRMRLCSRWFSIVNSCQIRVHGR